MAWIEQKPADPHRVGGCDKPDSKGCTEFGPGSTWECDVCDRRWLFNGLADDFRNGFYDDWVIVPGGGGR